MGDKALPEDVAEATAGGHAAKAAPTPSSGPDVLGLGEDHILEEGPAYRVRVAALNYEQPAGRTTENPPDDPALEYGAVEVRVCIDKTPEQSYVTWQPWALSYPDGRLFQPASSYNDSYLPAPVYPSEHDVPTGRCVRGWVPFEVPRGEKPGEVIYTNGDAPPVIWGL